MTTLRGRSRRRDEEDEFAASSSSDSDSSGEFADEGDWYESLIAGERVGEWLDVVEKSLQDGEDEDGEEKLRRA